MIRGFRALTGYARLRFAASDAANMVNNCGRHGFVYWDVRFSEESAWLCVSLYTLWRMSRCEDGAHPDWTVEEVRGLPRFLYAYRHRYGLAVGFLLATALVWLGSSVIWDIRVEGERRLSEEEVISCLQECGLHIGSVRREIQVDALQNRVLIHSDDISWISVNIIGTVAQVEIRETQTKEEEPDFVASNLVAARDGQIELFVDVRGNVVRKIGDVVRQGELLVSGIYDSATVGMRLVRSQGQVIARTEHTFSAEVPYQYEQKEYTGRIFTEKYLIFFEKEIKIFRNTGNLPSEYDTIERVWYGETFGGTQLPVGVRTVQYLEYTYQPCERTEQEARELAAYRLRCEAEPLLDGGTLLGERMEEKKTEEGIALTVHMEILENIALEKEIEVDLPSGAGWSKHGTENRKN